MPEGSSVVVIVKLKPSGTEVTIHRGQVVPHLWGWLCGAHIPSRAESIYQATFGMLYAHLPRMVCWGLSPDVIEMRMTTKDTAPWS